jgi:hypothetical protein
MPRLTWYYRSHEGLSLHGRLKPLFEYPIEVLANCRKFRYSGDSIEGSGKAILKVQPPPRTPGLSNHEFYALWAEDHLKYVAMALRTDGVTPPIKRYLRNKEVLEFMRATWDALLVGYQQERAWYLTKFGVSNVLNSRRLQGVNRFRNRLVYHPLEAAQHLKKCAQANRAWYFGGSKPQGRLLVFEAKVPAMMSSYIARALPPAPKDDAGLEGLMSRLTSEPQPEPDYWRPFLRSYVARWGTPSGPRELYTMPSSNAALGFPRSQGGHVAGVQHLVLLGYALKKTRSRTVPPSMARDDDGSYLELLSQSLHPSSQLDKKSGVEKLFRQPWDELERVLPGCGEYLQDYLKLAVEYVMERIDFVPILPIVAEEKGLKTRFPTCSLTAVNLVQQILRRVADHVMIRDPRFSEALGGDRGIDLRGADGPWESQDCTAATDYHPEWLTRGFYEELADRYPSLGPYRRWFSKLFGPKRILTCSADDCLPLGLLMDYPSAPLLNDEQMFFRSLTRREKEGLGHAQNILTKWDAWLSELNSLPGTISTTGQMMGDPTSFPALMLVSLCSADETLKAYPYTPKECKRRYRGLNRTETKMKGIGDDAVIPHWHKKRQSLYYTKIQELSSRLSWDKCFNHPTRGLLAEVPLQSGFEVPFWPTSVLVAPPGGSKGHVDWVSQPTAFGGDPTRPTRRIPKFFWKLSPYYYTWKLAERMGLPLGAPEAYGGISLPISPKRSSTNHVRWLTYLTQRPKEELIIGLGLAPLGKSGQSLLDRSAADWVKKVLAESAEWQAQGLELLSQCALSDTAERRVSLKEGYRTSVSRVRSVEFYFRAPNGLLDPSTPSVRMSCERFNRKVGSVFVLGSNMKYDSTIRDVERKTQSFFSTSGGFLPDPWAKPSSVYGLERSTEVKVRWKAPWIQGIG